MYGGYGFGIGGLRYELIDSYDLCFMQFNIGKTGVGNGNLNYGLGLKGGYVFNDYEEYNFAYKIPKNNTWIIEPSVFIRFGGKKAKMNIMVNYMWADNIPKSFYFPVNVGIGLNYKFGNRKKEL